MLPANSMYLVRVVRECGISYRPIPPPFIEEQPASTRSKYTILAYGEYLAMYKRLPAVAIILCANQICMFLFRSFTLMFVKPYDRGMIHMVYIKHANYAGMYIVDTSTRQYNSK